MSGPIVERLDNAKHHGGTRPKGADPAMIIWHTTRSKGTGRSSIDYLNSTKEKVASYYCVIERDGLILRMCPAGIVAWHCGDSAWPNPRIGDGTEDCRPNNGHSLNPISLGICWANDDSEKLTVEQIASGLYLAKMNIALYDIEVGYNLGHKEVSPGRKIDPNPIGFSMDDWRRQIAAHVGQ